MRGRSETLEHLWIETGTSYRFCCNREKRKCDRKCYFTKDILIEYYPTNLISQWDFILSWNTAGTVCYQQWLTKRERVKGRWRVKDHFEARLQCFTCDLLMTVKPVWAWSFLPVERTATVQESAQPSSTLSTPLAAGGLIVDSST